MGNKRRVWSLIGRRPVWLYHPHAVMLGQATHDGKYIPVPVPAVGQGKLSGVVAVHHTAAPGEPFLPVRWLLIFANKVDGPIPCLIF